jgi:hypothetical protein
LNTVASTGETDAKLVMAVSGYLTRRSAAVLLYGHISVYAELIVDADSHSALARRKVS